MNFLANLRQNFQSPGGSPQTPVNLSELGEALATSLRQRSSSAELVRACRQWARAVEVVQRSQQERMQHMRGQPKKLWTEQALIYADLTAMLSNLAETLEQSAWDRLAEQSPLYAELVEELELALQAMDEWWNSEELRCLRCGASPPEGHCRHCDLSLMRPIRVFAKAGPRQVALGEVQAEVLRGIQSVNAGMVDVSTLERPLQQLEALYRQVAEGLSRSEMAEVLEQLQRGLRGIQQMQRCFADHDAQHLEDGWNQFFVAELALKDLAAQAQASQGEALAEVSELRLSDQVLFSDEE